MFVYLCINIIVYFSNTFSIFRVVLHEKLPPKRLSTLGCTWPLNLTPKSAQVCLQTVYMSNQYEMRCISNSISPATLRIGLDLEHKRMFCGFRSMCETFCNLMYCKANAEKKEENNNWTKTGCWREHEQAKSTYTATKSYNWSTGV